MKNVVLLIFISLWSSCRFVPDSLSHKKKSSEPAPSKNSANYLSFEETINRLKANDRADQQDLSSQIERTWLWQNMQANLPKINTDQRKVLDQYTGALDTKSYQSSLSQNLEIDVPASRDFRFTVPARQSIRISVKSFCLNSSRHSPSSDLRFIKDNPTNENLARQILFKYLESRVDDEQFQSLMWSLESTQSSLKYMSSFVEVLNALGFQYSLDETVDQFLSKPSTRERAEDLGIGTSVEDDHLRATLIATRGYSGGDLILFNDSSDDIEIGPAQLKMRMMPYKGVLEDQTTASTNGYPIDLSLVSDMKKDVQNIYVSGTEPNRAGLELDSSESKVEELNSLNRTIDELIAKGEIRGKEVEIVNLARAFGAELLAQGEVEAGSAIYQKIQSLVSDIHMNSIHVERALKHGNDLRDIYEFATGKDLANDSALQVSDRGLNGLQLIASSGVMLQKGLDALARAGKVSEEIKEASQSLALATGKSENNGKTILGHYPAILEITENLGTKRFNIPNNTWEKMSSKDQWNANQKFLDQVIDRGDEIYLATRASDADQYSFFKRELVYLDSKGYKVSSDGRTMVRPVN